MVQQNPFPNLICLGSGTGGLIGYCLVAKAWTTLGQEGIQKMDCLWKGIGLDCEMKWKGERAQRGTHWMEGEGTTVIPFALAFIPTIPLSPLIFIRFFFSTEVFRI